MTVFMQTCLSKNVRVPLKQYILLKNCMFTYFPAPPGPENTGKTQGFTSPPTPALLGRFAASTWGQVSNVLLNPPKLRMCMSTTADTRSILTLAIAKSGPSPCSEAALKSAGYASRAEERADQSRFLTYLMVNRAGVEMFGVFIDMELITRFMGQATTGFLALLSYMLANLDITTEEVLSSLEDTGRYVSDSLADTGRYFSEMVHLK